MRFGFTERGDAGVDFSWHRKLAEQSFDGAVVITKKMSPEFNRLMLTAPKPCVLHCTCTGMGGTWLEPNVPPYGEQLDNLKALIDAGFPAERCVLRIDPIIPCAEGLQAAADVLDGLGKRKIPITRVRFSVYDEYRHVKQRLRDAGRNTFYPGDDFYASDDQKRQVADVLRRYPYTYETCAEDWAARLDPDRFVVRGCLSKCDLRLMGLDDAGQFGENMQNRTGCHCLGCKAEMLACKHRCPNQCLYCYWRD